MVMVFPVKKAFFDVFSAYPKLLPIVLEMKETQRSCVLEQIVWEDVLQAALLFAEEQSCRQEDGVFMIERLGKKVQKIWVEKELLCMEPSYPLLAEYVRRKHPCWILFDMDRQQPIEG